ncbi:golgin-84 [Diachasma alloeum]|uniref:golgin-84 n=1 Tax=Diachasma alloeum TaxID=454923 RepID=UPI0007384131|nr:golgin-84 [Diachasma alloeum]XP_015112367.1 golgin-84 [Diachasma alloeum]
MAWLSDLAGKAETLLNKIDQNTAAVLSKDNYDPEQDQLINVTSVDPYDSSQSNDPEAGTPTRFARFITTPQGTPKKRQLQNQEDLTTYLSSLSSASTRQTNGALLLPPPTPSSLSVETSDPKDSLSEYSHSGRSSPDLSHTLIDLPNPDPSSSDPVAENHLLRREIESLKNELLVSMHVERSIESEQSEMYGKLETLRQEYEYKMNQQRQQIEHLTKMSKSFERKQSKSGRKNLEQQNEFLSRQHTDNQKEIEVLREKMDKLEVENGQYVKQICDLKGVLERNRLDLLSTRQELEQHRARAIKTLQEKEKLIAELRENKSDAGVDNAATNMELKQLRQECNALRHENQQVGEQLRIAREELVTADLKIEEMSRKFGVSSREMQEIISGEKRKRVEAEEDARAQMEEVRAVKDELASQAGIWATKVRKQDTEISRLRSQLAAVSTPSSAVETRLATLTQTLVAKQNELEGLTTEKNALRLQLEKAEHEYRKLLGNSRKPYNVNDTDDAKAQVPTFLMETPFDTTMARKVKRAYSSLDAISVRTGVFLRRYPLARIFVIIYIALLQFWVFLVLLSQSPEAH